MASMRASLRLRLEAVDRQHAVGAIPEAVAQWPDALRGREHVARLARGALAWVEERSRALQRRLRLLAGLFQLRRGRVDRLHAGGYLVREHGQRLLERSRDPLGGGERRAGLLVELGGRLGRLLDQLAHGAMRRRQLLDLVAERREDLGDVLAR